MLSLFFVHLPGGIGVRSVTINSAAGTRSRSGSTAKPRTSSSASATQQPPSSRSAAGTTFFRVFFSFSISTSLTLPPASTSRSTGATSSSRLRAPSNTSVSDSRTSSRSLSTSPTPPYTLARTRTNSSPGPNQSTKARPVTPTSVPVPPTVNKPSAQPNPSSRSISSKPTTVRRKPIPLQTPPSPSALSTSSQTKVAAESETGMIPLPPPPRPRPQANSGPVSPTRPNARILATPLTPSRSRSSPNLKGSSRTTPLPPSPVDDRRQTHRSSSTSAYPSKVKPSVPGPSSSSTSLPSSSSRRRPETSPSDPRSHTVSRSPSNSALNSRSHSRDSHSSRHPAAASSATTTPSPLSQSAPQSLYKPPSQALPPSQTPPTHKQYGSGSDTSIKLDMRRLLSKPALVSGLNVSPESGDEWERERSRKFKDREINDAQTGPRRLEATPVPQKSGSVSGGSREGSLGRGSNSGHGHDSEKEKKVRNVLKRRPSAMAASGSKSPPSTPTASAFTIPGFGSRSNSQKEQRTASPSITAINTPIYYANRRMPSDIPDLRINPNAKVTHSRSMTSPGSGGSGSGSSQSASPAPLTPAGAVAQAYKQQELKNGIGRSYSASAVPSGLRSGSASKQASTSHGERNRRRAQDGHGGDKGTDELEDVRPYYTVLGSTTGRVVAVGGPEDDAWNLNLDTYFPVDDAKTTMTSTTVSGGRKSSTLSRKVSGKFKKISGKRDESPPATNANRYGRPSLQERRLDGSSKTKAADLNRRRSLRLSIDKFLDLPIEEMPLSSATTIPGTSSGPSTFSRSGKLSELGIDEAGSVGSGGSPNEHRSRKSDPSGLTGGKIWKLMKRISTGGLRDKYIEPSEPPPPVPALPKDYLSMIGPRSTDGHADQNGVLSRFIPSRSSMSAAHPYPRTAKMTKPPVTPLNTRPSTAGSRGTTGAARPSTTTRSSSPVSSDVASSKFFNRTHSTRSSTSSYGEEIPPPVPTLIGQHIVSPTELYRLNDDSGSKVSLPKNKGQPQNRGSPSSPEWTIVSPVDERPSLPTPPRRSTAKDSLPLTRSPSPIIPSFSTAAAINTFGVRKQSMGAGDGPRPQTRPSLSVVTPPPRPTRSPFRPPPDSSRVVPRIESPKPEEDTEGRKRESSGGHSNASTAKQRPRSASFTSSPPNGRSPLTFREMDSPIGKQTLSEKEKADKWDDLLERSALAGGTIHLGGGELMSDNIRFSTFSELSSK